MTRRDVASEIAHRQLLLGWTHAEVHEALGKPDGLAGGREERWHNGCSGPRCYNLNVEYKAGRVTSIGFLDEG